MATFQEVLDAARGRWPALVTQFCGHELLRDAIDRGGRKHVDCPVHGSSARKPFRVFKDFTETGGVICSHCGPKHNGIRTIAWLTNRDEVEVRNMLADELGLSADPSRRKRQPPSRTAAQATSAEEMPPPPGDEDLAAHVATAEVPEPSASVSSAQPKRARPSPATPRVQPALAGPATTARAPQQPKPPVVDERKRAAMRELWDAAIPLDHAKAGPARAYLAGRGIPLDRLPPLQDIRFVPKLDYWTETDDGKLHRSTHPAIVMAVRRPSGGIATLHRIYLDRRGNKAKVEDPKKLMGLFSDVPLTGSAIRLAEWKGGPLGVAEGPETAQAVMLATGMPVWPLITASLMAGFEPPEGVKSLIIWADKDRSKAGRRAAEALAGRMRERGIKVRVTYPKPAIPEGAKGIDWLDVLVENGPEAFPYRDKPKPPSARASKNGKAPWEYGSQCPHPTMSWDELSIPAFRRRQTRKAA